MHKLLANCTAAVRPRGDVINKMKDVLRESSPDDLASFEAMMVDERLGYCLMQNTLGDVALVTGDSTPRLLQQMRHALTAEVSQQKDDEIAKNKAEHDRLTKELEEAHANALAAATASTSQ